MERKETGRKEGIKCCVCKMEQRRKTRPPLVTFHYATNILHVAHAFYMLVRLNLAVSLASRGDLRSQNVSATSFRSCWMFGCMVAPTKNFKKLLEERRGKRKTHATWTRRRTLGENTSRERERDRREREKRVVYTCVYNSPVDAGRE